MQLDYLGIGLPLYHITRIIEETNEKFNDGSHIIYVNGSYKGNDAIGQLMHDFSCKDADEVYYNALKKGVRNDWSLSELCRQFDADNPKFGRVMQKIIMVKDKAEATIYSIALLLFLSLY